MKLPALPKSFFTLLGPATVKAIADEDKSIVGTVDYKTRVIQVDPNMVPSLQWLTLWHEVTHSALYDIGAHNVLTPEQTEAVCDAIGHYMLKAMEAGAISVSQARPRARSK